MNRYVIGDIHGGHKALLQCLNRANFNYEEDLLICLGDVADGWTEVPECFEELLKIKDLIYIIGNHDEWLFKWFKYGQSPSIWTSQGGESTIKAYLKYFEEEGTDISKRHLKLLEQGHYYYILNDMLFVHGGFDWHLDIKDQLPMDLMWDRDLFRVAQMWQTWWEKDKPLHIVKDYKEVFVGHTTTSRSHPNLEPVHVSNVWNLDQGAGWEGKLSIMNIDTKEFFQSDIVRTLYPGVKGR